MRTAEELRARFLDDHATGMGAARGNPIEQGGRRLTDFDLDEQEERLRMPEPMPISWVSPVQPQPPSAFWRHAGAAVLGLAVGLVIAVPGVLWQKGRIDPVASIAQMAENFGLAAAAPKAAVMTPDVRESTVEIVRAAAPRNVSVPVETVRAEPATAALIPPAASPKPAVQLPFASPSAAAAPEPIVVTPAPAAVAAVRPAPIIETPPVQSEAAKAEGILEEARRLMGEGDFRAARVVLEDQVVSSLPTARFLLAETYDPIVLAARAIRSGNVRAEVPRAVELYRLALDGGVDAARQRLNALKP